LIRTRLQVWGQVARSSSSSAGSIGVAAAAAPAHQAMTQMLRDIIKTDGIRGCFRGLGATLVTVPTFWGVYCE
jgi:Mitochondrial carrier protein